MKAAWSVTSCAALSKHGWTPRTVNHRESDGTDEGKETPGRDPVRLVPRDMTKHDIFHFDQPFDRTVFILLGYVIYFIIIYFIIYFIIGGDGGGGGGGGRGGCRGASR